ncbi:MAG: hypothetical protein H3C30_08855 [Candidatus Hydrogenedentes bacterium]|nr:hypothetical protein [Candidatus Hydrogenedentota bacterium]
MSTKPKHDPNVRCETCRHWWTPTETCHRGHPSPMMLATIEGADEWATSTRTYWPRTSPRAWCGSHEPVPSPVQEQEGEASHE